MAVRPNRSGAGGGASNGGGRDKSSSGKAKANDSKDSSLHDGAKPKGFMTYDEVNDALPHDLTSSADQLDDMIGIGDEDIEIVDATTQVKIAPKRIADEEALEHKKVPTRGNEEAADDGDAYYSKSNDPVRMYLRKMGTVSLLTREGEVEIAKRIENGEHQVLAAILSSPIAVREIIDIGEKLKKHKIRVKEIIRDAEETDENVQFDEEEADRRIIRLIDKVKGRNKKLEELRDAVTGLTAELAGDKRSQVLALFETALNEWRAGGQMVCDGAS